jgi:hypothetical protein
LKTQQRTFFECRDLVRVRPGQESTSSPFGATFERKLDVNELAGGVVSTPVPAERFFTESLILAQDERWRRA